MISINFLLTALVIVLIPGTGVIYTINTGLTQKPKIVLAAAFGCTIGIIPHVTACILGLSAVMHMSANLFTTIKYIGAGYLMYLAWKTWTSAGKIELGAQNHETSVNIVAFRGVLLNLLNPKLTLFFFSFLPQFIPVDTNNKIEQMLVLSFVFMILTFIIFVIYGLLACLLREIVQKRRKIMKNIEKGFALTFASLSIKLALEDK